MNAWNLTTTFSTSIYSAMLKNEILPLTYLHNLQEIHTEICEFYNYIVFLAAKFVQDWMQGE
jgi:hypothetical protein